MTALKCPNCTVSLERIKEDNGVYYSCPQCPYSQLVTRKNKQPDSNPIPTPVTKQCAKCKEIELHTPNSEKCYCGGNLFLYHDPINNPSHPTSEEVSPGIDQIPFEGLEAIGAIFKEGEAKYGRDNWKKLPTNSNYNQERTRHAIRHLYLYANGDRSENHLAKVAWFCVTTIWRTRHES